LAERGVSAQKKRGRFITFEGGEGAGKSTQIELLADRLQERKLSVVVTREPGGSPSAEDIRRLVVSGAVWRWDPLTELLLHNAARREHVRNMIRPVLNRGRWVLCDRFVDSTMAYQGYGHGLGPKVVNDLHRIISDNLMPDLTIILDVPTETGLARARARSEAAAAKAAGNSGEVRREDRYERMAKPFHRRLRRGFLDIAERDPKRCRVINANRSIEAVAADVWDAVAKRFRLPA
jgi:dTMP kinase